MTCKFCGKEMDDNADFCPVCGQGAEPAVAKADSKPAPGDEKDYQLDDAAGEPTADVADIDDDEPTAVIPDETDAASETPEEVPAKEKKPKKEKAKANFFLRLVSFLFILIGLIIYAVMKRKSTPEKAYSIANAVLAGLCVRLFIVILYFMMSYGWITLDFLMPIIAKLSGQG
ncbi:MAG: zinc ribbon domain-containing protein [Clostridia bacterium]|nr:zinc ribbon domain-containing protein [Clostridia bacterium]